MGLRNLLGLERNGCTGHHFTNYTPHDQYRSLVNTVVVHDDESHSVEEKPVVVVKRKYVAVCEHEGCDAVDVEYREVDWCDVDE